MALHAAARIAALWGCAALLLAAPGLCQQPAEDPDTAQTVAAPADASASAPKKSQLDEDIRCDGTSLMSAILMMPELSTLRAALRVAGLQSFLNNDKARLTLFAPTDGAFAVFADDMGTTPAALMTDPLRLRQLLLYHLVPQPTPPAVLASSPVFDTFWGGKSVYVPQPFQNVVSGESGTTALISKAVRVCDSYMYLVSYILLPGPSLDALPPFVDYQPPAAAGPPAAPPVGPMGPTGAAPAPGPMASQPCNPGGTALEVLRSTPSLSYTLSAFDAANLTSVLSNASTSLTLLAPEDAAWKEGAAEFQANGPTDLLQRLDRKAFRALLAAHIIPRTLHPAQLTSQLLTTLGGPAAGPLYLSVGEGNVTVQTPTSEANVIAAGLGDSCTHTVYVLDHLLMPEHLPKLLPPKIVQRKK